MKLLWIAGASAALLLAAILPGRSLLVSAAGGAHEANGNNNHGSFNTTGDSPSDHVDASDNLDQGDGDN